MILPMQTYVLLFFFVAISFSAMTICGAHIMALAQDQVAELLAVVLLMLFLA